MNPAFDSAYILARKQQLQTGFCQMAGLRPFLQPCSRNIDLALLLPQALRRAGLQQRSHSGIPERDSCA